MFDIESDQIEVIGLVKNRWGEARESITWDIMYAFDSPYVVLDMQEKDAKWREPNLRNTHRANILLLGKKK